MFAGGSDPPLARLLASYLMEQRPPRPQGMHRQQAKSGDGHGLTASQTYTA